MWGLSVIITLLVLSASCRAANHYCTNSRTSVIELDDSDNREALILPSIAKEHDDGLQSNKSCRWIVQSSVSRPGLQVVVQALPIPRSTSGGTSLASGDPRDAANITISFNGDTFLATDGTFLVNPISELIPLTVESNWNPRTQTENKRLKLRVLLALPRLEDVLCHRGSCYAVSFVRDSLTAVQSALRGQAYLARFSSLTDINELTSANLAREMQHPYRRPLDLSQPVRLGLLYRASGAVAVSPVGDGLGGCRMQPVPLAEVSPAQGQRSGPCLTLIADAAGRAMVESSNCTSPMSALIAFPENGSAALDGSTVNSECSELILAELQSPQLATTAAAELARLTKPTVNTEMPQALKPVGQAPSSTSAGPTKLLIFFVVLGLILFVFILLVVTGVSPLNESPSICRRRRNSDRQPEEIRLLPVEVGHQTTSSGKERGDQTDHSTTSGQSGGQTDHPTTSGQSGGQTEHSTTSGLSGGQTDPPTGLGRQISIDIRGDDPSDSPGNYQVVIAPAEWPFSAAPFTSIPEQPELTDSATTNASAPDATGSQCDNDGTPTGSKTFGFDGTPQSFENNAPERSDSDKRKVQAGPDATTPTEAEADTPVASGYSFGFDAPPQSIYIEASSDILKAEEDIEDAEGESDDCTPPASEAAEFADTPVPSGNTFGFDEPPQSIYIDAPDRRHAEEDIGDVQGQPNDTIPTESEAPRQSFGFDEPPQSIYIEASDGTAEADDAGDVQEDADDANPPAFGAAGFDDAPQSLYLDAPDRPQ